MTPNYSFVDIEDGCARHSESRGDDLVAFAGSCESPNLAHVFIAQFGRWMGFSYKMVVAVFLGTIFVVIGLSAREQVRGIAAFGIVASMQHENVIFQWSVRQSVSHSMTAFWSSNPERAVSRLQNTSSPRPTRPQMRAMTLDRTVFVDFVPESFGDCRGCNFKHRYPQLC